MNAHQGTAADRPITWWTDRKGLVLADRDPSGGGGERLSGRTRVSIAVSVVIGLAAVGVVVYMLLGNEITVRRRRREYDVSIWVPVVVAVIMFASPWALSRLERTGGLGSRVLTAMPKLLAVVQDGVIYRIPWASVVGVTPHEHPGHLVLHLAGPARSFAAVNQGDAPGDAVLVLRAGDGARVAAVLDQLRVDEGARARLTDPAAAEWANGAR